MYNYEDDHAACCKYPLIISEAGTQTEFWNDIPMHMYTEDVFNKLHSNQLSSLPLHHK